MAKNALAEMRAPSAALRAQLPRFGPKKAGSDFRTVAG